MTSKREMDRKSWCRRTKPRRLREETEEGASNTSTDLFDIDTCQLLYNLNNRPIIRPLPAVHAMLAVAPQRRSGHQPIGKILRDSSDAKKNLDVDRTSDEKKKEAALRTTSEMPLMKDFLKKISNRKKKVIDTSKDEKCHEDTVEKKDNSDGVKSEREIGSSEKSPIDQISTILTKGHHRKFQELLAIFGKNANNAVEDLSYKNRMARKKEFGILCELFLEERNAYSLALEQFRLDNSKRFAIGFNVPGPASKFVGIKSQFIKRYKDRWEQSKIKPSKSYGKLIQTISLNGSLPMSPIDVEMFSPEIIYKDQNRDFVCNDFSLEKIKSTLENKTLQEQRNILRVDSNTLLSEDEKARELATKYDVDVVLSSNALEAMITSQKWDLPILCDSSSSLVRPIVFFEDPIPAPSNPRECLTVGITEALYGQLLCNMNEGEEKVNHGNGCNTYTLLTLTLQTTKVKVLVRSRNYLFDSNNRPVILRGQVEYFSNYGMEDIPVHESAWWFIQKVLQPDCRLLLCRVDALSTRVIRIEEKSVADAILGHNPADSEIGLGTLGRFESNGNVTVEHQIQMIVNVIFGATRIERDRRWGLICYPSRCDDGVSHGVASVHKALGNNQKISPCFEVEKAWKEAEAVFLNAIDFRLWTWENEDRVPYCFPLQEEKCTV
mmetsp:Transcript_14006/g.20919  ORF Transcript_14006/g.20919 Transcript_14006/m.20919 type:complete len:665 (-) Transcript_14006:31-2025(-)